MATFDTNMVDWNKRFGGTPSRFNDLNIGGAGVAPMQAPNLSTAFTAPDAGFMSGGGKPLMGIDAPVMNQTVGMPVGADLQTDAPGVQGKWTDSANFGLGVAKVGLGVYNAYEQAKMNKFMRGYYGDQQALQEADFANAAKSTNEALSARQGRILSAQGQTTGTDANKQGVADYMKEWGVQETV